VEALANTRYFVDEIKEYVSEVKVIDPYQFKVISKSVKKTDKNDAKKIAEFLSKGMVPEVKLKDKAISQINSIANTRDKLVKLRTSLKNKVHNLLNSEGIDSRIKEFSGKKALRQVLKHDLDPILKLELEVIVEQIEKLTEGIKKLDTELEERGKGMDGFENITSIKGVGNRSGTILLSIIGDINNFSSRKKLSAYFGIVPRVSQSGEKVVYGRITKRGSKLGRTTLTQCTLTAIQYSPYLGSFYNKIKAKKGCGKARVATSKKLLEIIYDTLKNRWVFEDFPNFVKKTV
jgi:transposase